MRALDIVILGYGAFRLYEESKTSEGNEVTKAAYWALGTGVLGAYAGPKLFDVVSQNTKSMNRTDKEEAIGAAIFGLGGAVGGYMLGNKALKSFNKAYSSAKDSKVESQNN